jgi:hypothetical protein
LLSTLAQRDRDRLRPQRRNDSCPRKVVCGKLTDYLFGCPLAVTKVAIDSRLSRGIAVAHLREAPTRSARAGFPRLVMLFQQMAANDRAENVKVISIRFGMEVSKLSQSPMWQNSYIEKRTASPRANKKSPDQFVRRSRLFQKGRYAEPVAQLDCKRTMVAEA